MAELISAENVQNMLRKHKVPFNRWGKGPTKTFEHLMRELELGESTLIETQGGKLLRLVGVVRVTVEHKRGSLMYLLVETEQRFANGSTRQRGLRFVGGKISAGESPQIAAVRELKEEIGLEGADVEVLRKFQVSDHSPSFPGLRVLYVCFDCHCLMLPQFYRPEGYSSVQDGITTVFEWAKEEDEIIPSDP